MTETDPLKRLYRRLRDNVTQGVAGDVMQMPPSWGELLTAVHEAAFPDGDEEPEPITVPEPVADVLRGIAEQMAAGARVVVLRESDETNTVTTGKEAAARIQYAAGWDDGYAEGAKAQREADHRLLVNRGERLSAWLLDLRPLVTDDTDVTEDSDDDTTTVTSGIEAAKRIGYAEGCRDGYAEGHANGYRKAVLRFADGGEA